MTKLNPYIIFPGNCEEAFDYYKTVFGVDTSYLSRYQEMPEDTGMKIPEEHANKVMHVSLPITSETVLMGCDQPPVGQGGETAYGNNISLSISADTREDADTFFGTLAEDGTVTMPLQETFWGDFGMCIDKFGVNWMIGFNEEEAKTI